MAPFNPSARVGASPSDPDTNSLVGIGLLAFVGIALGAHYLASSSDPRRLTSAEEEMLSRKAYRAERLKNAHRAGEQKARLDRWLDDKDLAE